MAPAGVLSQMAEFLAVPRPQRFHARENPQAQAELESLLESQADTKPVRIGSLADVLLDRQGRIQGRYRLTAPALMQLGSTLGPGLGQLALNLAGARPRLDVSGEVESPELAVRIVNDMIRLRFELLRGRGMIVDHRARVVEGFVGSRYRFLGNYEFYSRARKALPREAKFHEAVVVGRQAMFRFLAPGPLRTLTSPSGREEPFYAGWHFSNGELGDCCVRASAFLYRAWSDTSSIETFNRATSFMHSRGPTFERRLERLFDTALRRVETLGAAAEKLPLLLRRRLGFGAEGAKTSERVDRLARLLSNKDLGVSVVRDAIYRALAQGSYKRDRVDVVSAESWGRQANLVEIAARRTAFDLYNALGAVAKGLSVTAREHTEVAAYRLLTHPDLLS